jgi:uncharacterized protein
LTVAAHLAQPFAFDWSGRAATNDGDPHLQSMIMAVLFTAPGERVNRPEFGCGIKQLLFAPLDETLAAATQQMIQGALLRWLGDLILVEAVDVRAADATLSIHIVFVVRATSERQTAVFERAIAA